jgi:glutathione S-transferase
MKLYVTLTSPYARMVRVLIIEKGIEDKVEVVPIQTRTLDTPLLAINPAGRVPTLVNDDGEMFDESALIIDYLESVYAPPLLAPLADWNARRLEAHARSMLDGLSVWIRELRRLEHHRSPIILELEEARGLRMAKDFDAIVASGALDGPLDLAQLTLGCTLHGRDQTMPDYDWRTGNENLSAWVDRFGARESMQRTVPPGYPTLS